MMNRSIFLGILLTASISFAQAVQILSNPIVEGSDSSITVKFEGQNGECVRPNTIDLTILDRNTGTVLQKLTPPVPSPKPTQTPGGNYPCQVKMDIPRCSTRMIGNSNTQTNQLSLTFTYGTTANHPAVGSLTQGAIAEYVVQNDRSKVVMAPTGSSTCVIATPTPTPTSAS